MASLNLRPLGDRVVVKPLGREEVTKSGIVLPDTAKEKPQQGEVLAVGPGRVLDNGERVVPGRQAGREGPVRQVLGHRVQASNRMSC